MGHFPGFAPETRITGRLTTAGLGRIIVDSAARLLEHFDGVFRRVGKELIHETWYKQIDLQVCHFEGKASLRWSIRKAGYQRR